MFSKKSSQTIYKNKWMTVFEDQIVFPNGKVGSYGYVKRSDGAAFALVNQQNEILLIKQYRYPIQNYEWNLPGGALEDDDPESAIRREVKEEVGIEIKEVEKIGEFFPLSSCSTEKSHIYFARMEKVELSKIDVSSDDEEIVEKRFFPVKEVLTLIDKGEITDGNTANIVQLVARRLGIK